jgi:hypothetical protein
MVRDAGLNLRKGAPSSFIEKCPQGVGARRAHRAILQCRCDDNRPATISIIIFDSARGFKTEESGHGADCSLSPFDLRGKDRRLRRPAPYYLAAWYRRCGGAALRIRRAWLRPCDGAWTHCSALQNHRSRATPPTRITKWRT